MGCEVNLEKWLLRFCILVSRTKGCCWIFGMGDDQVLREWLNDNLESVVLICLYIEVYMVESVAVLI